MRLAVAALAVGVLLGPAAGAASAFYGNGASIVSASDARQEEGDAPSTFGAISADGRYVAFETQAGNFFDDADPDPPGQTRRGGVFRRELATGALEKVANGDFVGENDPNSRILLGAHKPSISADGRYVVFSTAEKLVAQDTNNNVDVYRRDMDVPATAPTAYTLVSAPDGSDPPAPPAYAAAASPSSSGDPGSDVWPGQAISSDGTRVVFTTAQAGSSLPGSGPSTPTPAGQVFVRDLTAHTTTLVTEKTSDGSAAGGASGPAGISGDGTTVVWTGANARDQTAFLNGETATNGIFLYLWKRIADGAAAPARRITGPVDVDDPGCAPGASVSATASATGPCYGPLGDYEGAGLNISRLLPSLSGDGGQVAFLSGAPPRPFTDVPPGLEAWVTDMRPGVSRKRGSRELTRSSSSSSDPRTNALIDGIALSADGRHVVLATNRTEFLLPGLAQVGTFPTTPAQRNLDLVDLDADTIERVTRSYTGDETDGAAGARPTLSSDGNRIAFASDATNMFFGDANAVTDVFVATRTAEPQPPPPPPPAPPPAPPTVIDQTPPAPPRITVKAKPQRNGSVRLVVTVPAAGRVTARARGRLRYRALRTLASARATATRKSSVTLVLRLRRADVAALRARRAVRASARVVFAPTAPGKSLTRTLAFVFRLQGKHKRQPSG